MDIESSYPLAAEAGDSRLSALITRAEAAGRDPDRAIDWSRSPLRPLFIPPRLYRILVSQLYHGERATLAMCERLMGELPDAGARRFVATQAVDETRHAQLYARYLDGIGGMAPADDAVRRTFDAALAWDGPWQGLSVADPAGVRLSSAGGPGESDVVRDLRPRLLHPDPGVG